MKTPRTRSFLAIAAIMCALLVSACSSSENKTTTDKSGDDVGTQSQALVADLIKRPMAIGPSDPLGDTPPAGKTVYWIECGAPACANLGDAIEAAAEVLDWKVVRVQAGLTPETIKNAWGEAARAEPAPDAVMSSGFPREIFEEELTSLADRGIPIVNISVTDEAGDGLTASIGTPDARNTRVGIAQAELALSYKGADTNAVFVKIPVFPTLEPQSESFKARFSELCADCPVDIVDMPAESMGSDLPDRLVAYLQRNSDVNTVVLGYGDLAIGVPDAIRSAGLDERVVVLTDTPDPTVAKYIADNDVVVAATGYPGPEMAWTGIDIIIRTMLDESIEQTASAELPMWVLTSENVPSTTGAFPLVEDYQEQFKSLWGVK